MGLSQVRILIIFSSSTFKIHTTMNKKGLKCVLFKNLFLSLIDRHSASESDSGVVKWRIREKFRTIFNYCDCQASYIGETGRNVSTRLTEHKRATRNGDVNNHIAEHHLKTKHQIDWDSATCITYCTDYYQRLTLESCMVY